MIRSKLYKLGQRILIKHPPRWIIYAIDISITVLSLILAFFVRLNFNFSFFSDYPYVVIIGTVVAVRSTYFIFFRIYFGLIRFSTFTDLERVIFTNTLGTATLILINIIHNHVFGTEINLIPYGVVIMEFLLTTFLMISLRLLVKTIYLEVTNRKENIENVLIYGTGQFADLTRQVVENNSSVQTKVIGYICPGQDKWNYGNTLMGGIRTYHETDIEALVAEYNIKKLIIAEENSETSDNERLIVTCSNLHVKVLKVPNAKKWIDGSFRIFQISELKIEDLLERPVIILDDREIEKYIMGKVILVTGAAGSIGSELARQISRYLPSKIILFDQAETPLHSFSLELQEKLLFKNFELVMGDITNQHRLENIFSRYRPDIVFHAAAYKHVPMLEDNPKEAMQNNVLGTKILADLSVQFNISRFIMVSTDKAVNPTSIMGASKRICEMYIQSLSSKENHHTQFITTRFGNVLWSNGSAIVKFKDQIENGGPITITHPDVSRYFMTLTEAVELVLEASTMGSGGEIFVFEMGKMVKIRDLACKMIRLAGLVPEMDIKIKYIGLRAGERLYEELLSKEEELLPTHHPKILIGKVNKVSHSYLSDRLNDVFQRLHMMGRREIVTFMKELVPEFKSNNPRYASITDSVASEDNIEYK